jgi:hypothetical protein
LYGVKIWILRKIHQKYLGSLAMWYWRRMDISWTDRVRNEQVLQGIFYIQVNRRKANWIGHILRKTCLLKHDIELAIDRRIEVTGTRERRSKQLLHDLEEKRGILEIERGSTRSYSVGNSLWKRLWTCLKTDSGMNALCSVYKWMYFIYLYVK